MPVDKKAVEEIVMRAVGPFLRHDDEEFLKTDMLRITRSSLVHRRDETDKEIKTWSENIIEDLQRGIENQNSGGTSSALETIPTLRRLTEERESLISRLSLLTEIESFMVEND